MTRSFRKVIGGVTLISLVTLGAALAWRNVSEPNRALQGVPQTPDLSRWPGEFRAEIEVVSAEVRKGTDSLTALARLGTLYLANDLYPQAEQPLRVLHSLDPLNARYTYLLAVVLTRRGRPAEAETLFRATIELAPDYLPARFQLGQLLAQSGRDQEAIIFYEQRLAKEPNDVLSTLGIVDIERRQGRTDSAVSRLEHLLEAEPFAAEARLLLAEILDTLGQAEAASAQRIQAQRSGVASPTQDPWLDQIYLQSYDPFRLQTLGVMRLQAGALDEALPYLERAAGLAPDDGDVIDSYATALVRLGRHDEAIATLKTAWERTQAVVVVNRLAELLTTRGEPSEAEAVLREAITKRPNEGLLHQGLGRLLLTLRKNEEAAAALAEALELQPTLTEAQLNLGRALYALGNYTEARRAIEKAVEMRPDSSESLMALAEIEVNARNWARAGALLSRASKAGNASPAYADIAARVGLGRANEALAAGLPSEAEAIYREALLHAPAHGPLHGALAALLGKMNRLSESKAMAQRYVELSPSDARSWFLLGAIDEQLGNRSAAGETYRRGLEVAQKTGDSVRIRVLEQALQRIAR